MGDVENEQQLEDRVESEALLSSDSQSESDSSDASEEPDLRSLCEVDWADLQAQADFVEELMAGSDCSSIQAAAKAELQDLETLQARYFKNNAMLLSKMKDDKDEIVRVQAKRTKFTFLYRKTRSKLVTVLEESPNTSVRTGNFKKNLKLPKVEIPTFSGSSSNWVAFKGLFTSLIHNNVELDDDTRHHFLRSLLSGEPLVLIQNLPLTAENYEEAWKTITRYYDDPFRQIAEHFNALHRCPISNKGSPTLKELIVLFRQHVVGLRSILKSDPNIDALGQCMTFWFLTKCDKGSRNEWERELSRRKQFQSFEEFLDFMESRSAAFGRSAISETRNAEKSTTPKNIPHRRGVATAATTSPIVTKYCVYCRKRDHFVPACGTFRELPAEDRVSFVKKKRLCLYCLRADCRPSRCSKMRCRVCDGSHNTILHVKRERKHHAGDALAVGESFNISTLVSNSNDNRLVSDDNVSNKSAFRDEQSGDRLPLIGSTAAYRNIYQRERILGNALNSTTKFSEVLLSTALIEISVKFTNYQARSLLDQGSQFNFISRDFVNKLNLRTETAAFTISGINTKPCNVDKQVRIEVKSINSSYRERIQCLVLDKITEDLPAQYFSVENWNIPAHLPLADPSFHIPGSIDLLLGGEVFWNVLGNRNFRLKNNLPTLRDSKLGWLVTGAIKFTRYADNQCLLTSQPSNAQLLEALERFWAIESFPNDNAPSDNITAENIFTSTTYRDKGRFVVKLPFKGSVETLGESKSLALNRFRSLEKRFRRDPSFKEQYVASINDFIVQGHMREVNPADNAALSYYIPHHAVIKNTSTSTKLRTVFDASMKTSTGVSLNDLLLVGPVIQHDLISILLRFRLRKWVFVADIRQMYRQIKIRDEDAVFQRIFWRQSEELPIKIYEIPVLLFGTASAPFLATRCLKALADEIRDDSSLVKAALNHDFYVDDVLSGADSIESALQLQADLIKTLSTAGFELSKWCTNHPDLIKNIPHDRIESQFPLQSCDKKTIKTLGLLWLPNDDEFKIWLHLSHPERAITKRQVLSVIASLFDPMGFIGPVSVQAKLIMQAIWQLQDESNSKKVLSWDDEITNDLKRQWIEFSSELNEINNIRIPRYSFGNNQRGFEIHGFCDASEKAIGAVIYIRSLTTDKVNVSLLCAKSKVNPKAKQTIPRLELCGALLLSELINKVSEIISISHEVNLIRLWTDSTIVLCWIRADAQRWQQYVANRVQKIQNLTLRCIWDHVGTNSNPADILSRGCTPNELKGCELWWKGPQWLYDTIEPWSTEVRFKYENTALPELRRVRTVAALTTVSKDNVFDKFSSYQRLIRTTAYVGRFIRNSRTYAPRTTGELKYFEINVAILTLVKISQWEYFDKEIRALRRNSGAEITGPLKNLTPVLDESGILRVGGRLENAVWSYEQRHPIILSPHHKFTKLLVHHFHITHVHAGPRLLKSAIRRQYWILRVHSAINNCLMHCIKCIRQRAETKTQIMANLPKNRLIPCKPFSNTGIDYAGPIQLIERRTRSKARVIHKAYIAVFVCFTTKAVHLELVSDLTAEAFIAALDRFTGRRGIPLEIHSDNGGNFVGANTRLQKRKLSFDAELTTEVLNYASFKGFKWHFNPPYAPHFGGLWEAAVKSVKGHLVKLLGGEGVVMTFEEYSTILIRIEACLNSRPLIPESNDPNDINALTPGHFLTGGPITALPNPNLMEIPDNRLTYWERVRKLQQLFWARWSAEYLNTLQQRTKWRLEKDNLTVNSLVIIKEDNMPPARWALGRIQQLHPGRDNKARVATLKTANGIVTRAITKLIPLPLSNEYESNQN